MALLEVRTEWAVYKDCFLQVARYQADNSRAIEIWNNEDGPIARITVCIAGSGLAEDETVIDTNNWASIEKMIAEGKYPRNLWA